MDFITKLPRTTRVVDSIWVIMDRLTKSTYFISIKESISTEKLVEIYVKEVVTRHRVPVSVFSDRDARFTLDFGSGFMMTWALVYNSI